MMASAAPEAIATTDISGTTRSRAEMGTISVDSRTVTDTVGERGGRDVGGDATRRDGNRNRPREDSAQQQEY